MKLEIRVTKDVLRRSAMCKSADDTTGTNCAVALAVRDIFPKAYVGNIFIHPLGQMTADNLETSKLIVSPLRVRAFIEQFDYLKPEQRILMPEISFEIDIPNSVIEKINIDEIRPLLVNHPTLTLIETTV